MSVDVQDVAVAIMAGDLDADDITVLVAAIRHAANNKQVRMCWQVAFDDLIITEENQTLIECEVVERQTRKRWGAFHPANSAAECAAIITAALVERQGLTAEQAMALLKKKTAAEIVRNVTEYAAGDPPLDNGAPAT